MGENKIYIQTDEEFNKSRLMDNKNSVLDSLLEASKTNKKFSTKDLKKQESEKPKSKMSSEELSLSIVDIPERSELNISDEEWENMMDYFDDISPIDDITNEGRFSYRSKKDGDEYQTLFKKEQSMLNDVLSDLQKRSKLVNKRIDSLSGKGPGGISKNYVELVEASVSLDSTKLSVIKELVNVKKVAADLRMKDKKLNPETDGDDRDSVADAFYKQIMGGNNKTFLQNTVGQYSSLQNGGIVGTRSDGNSFSQNGSPIDSEYVDDIGFNITQMIPSNNTDTYDDDDLNIDNYGYIANENRNVDICLYRYEDGTLKFVALDENGVKVDNYELPDDGLLSSIRIKPMSSYAYDEFDRKYKIIDQVANGVDLSDLDDDIYDNLTNDDKYDID